MSQITVSATDSQGKTHIFDKPVPFDPSNNPFLFGLERGRKEAAREIIELLGNYPVPMSLCTEIITKFGLEI